MLNAHIKLKIIHNLKQSFLCSTIYIYILKLTSFFAICIYFVKSPPARDIELDNVIFKITQIIFKTALKTITTNDINSDLESESK